MTSPDTNSRGRPGGRPREMRSSPESRPTTLCSEIRGAHLQLSPSMAAIDSPRTVCCAERADASRCGRRSLPPTGRRGCRNQGRKPWRERPGRARLQWPRACPEGRSRHVLSVSRVDCPRVRSRCGKRRRIRLTCARRSEPDCPDDLVPFVRENLAMNRDSYWMRCRAECRRRLRAGSRSNSMSWSARGR